jgi:hypothetical protein
MKPEQLAKLCIDNINRSSEMKMKPQLSLVLPAGSSRAKHRQPFGKGGPRGTIVAWGIPEGKDTVIFNTIDLLAYLTAIGVIEVTV